MAGISPPKALLLLVLAIGNVTAFAVWFHAMILTDSPELVPLGDVLLRLLAVAYHLLVGAVLVLLMFISKRHGYDNDLARRIDVPRDRRLPTPATAQAHHRRAQTNT